jgi:endo-1,4-beta-xylanase
MSHRWIYLGTIVATLATCRAVLAAESAEAELIAGADARIENCRKADATISVVGVAGKPVVGAKINVEQIRHAFLFGSNIFVWGKVPDVALEQAFRQRFVDLLNYATLPFYWPMYEPRQGSPIHAHTEEVARWCHAHGILAKGHPLAWNMGDPGWLPRDPAEIHRLQLARIDDCVRRFRGLIDRWDVVNEVTEYDREEFAKRAAPKYSAMWKQYGQISFPRECFQQARQANPEAVLLINDYVTAPAYERVIAQLVDSQERRLYDVIGIQSHMHGGAWSNERIWKVCEEFARFGVPLHFTETTILSGERTWDKKPGNPWPSTTEGEAYQAREVARFYTMLFSHPAVTAITWWDFSDNGAWKGAPAGLVHKDMTPKSAYDALKRLIKDKWWTRVELASNPGGTAAFRGFLGEYRVTVRAPGKPEIAGSFVLEKWSVNRWRVKIESNLGH